MTPTHDRHVALQAGQVRAGRERARITVGLLRQLVQQLPADAEVLIGIEDEHHFNRLLGELPVRAASAVTSSACPALLLHVDGLS